MNAIETDTTDPFTIAICVLDMLCRITQWITTHMKVKLVMLAIEGDNDCDSVNGFCVNKEDKYLWRCNDGYFEAYAKETECVDINKCDAINTDDAHDCDINACYDNFESCYNY